MCVMLDTYEAFIFHGDSRPRVCAGEYPRLDLALLYPGYSRGVTLNISQT